MEFVSIHLFCPRAQWFLVRVDLSSRGAFVVFVFVAFVLFAICWCDAWLLLHPDGFTIVYLVYMYMYIYIYIYIYIYMCIYGVVILVARVCSCHAITLHRIMFCFVGVQSHVIIIADFVLNCMLSDVMSLQGECSRCYDRIMCCGCVCVCVCQRRAAFTRCSVLALQVHVCFCKLPSRCGMQAFTSWEIATLCCVLLWLVPTQPLAIRAGTCLSVSSQMSAEMHWSKSIS